MAACMESRLGSAADVGWGTAEGSVGGGGAGAGAGEGADAGESGGGISLEGAGFAGAAVDAGGVTDSAGAGVLPQLASKTASSATPTDERRAC